MRKDYTNKIFALQSMAKEDARYCALVEEYEILDRRLLAALEEMQAAHRETVMDYLGLIHAINLQTVMIALTLHEKC